MFAEHYLDMTREKENTKFLIFLPFYLDISWILLTHTTHPLQN